MLKRFPYFFLKSFLIGFKIFGNKVKTACQRHLIVYIIFSRGAGSAFFTKYNYLKLFLVYFIFRYRS